MEESAGDHSLLRRIRTGDQDASTALYNKYVRQLHALTRRHSGSDLARRVEADDIVQSVFRTFFRRVSGGEFEVPAGEDLWKLLLTIALNKSRNAAAFHRASKRDLSRETNSSHLAEQVPAEDAFPRLALQMVIEDVMQGLDESQRRIVELRIDGAEVHDIATATGRAKRSVERVLHGFRSELTAKLRADGMEIE